MVSRVPRWGDITVQCDFRNNVIYDWGYYCGYGDMRTLNYVNNYLRKGPSTTQNPPYLIHDPKVILPASLYVNGNFKATVLPGQTQAFMIEHRWNPTVLTAWGDSDSGGPWKRIINGGFNKYVWKLN